MRLAVLSGKGGTGKTFVSVNLAYVAKHATYIDCDVEEPNGRLFLKPANTKEIPVHTLLPIFDADKCIGCRACVDFCHFNALVYIRNKPKIFPDVCHSCGGCQLVCKQRAITEEPRQVGIVEIGNNVVTGILNLGEASAIPVIQSALQQGLQQKSPNLYRDSLKDAQDMDNIIIIDCPPGSSCAAMESVSEADYCVLVVEPTAFGFHNFQMVYELVSLMGKHCGVVINKADREYLPLTIYCKEQNIPILLEIPYTEELARLSSHGEIVVQHIPDLALQFQDLLESLRSSLELLHETPKNSHGEVPQ